MSELHDEIAEVLELADPKRPDYCTNVEIETLQRWQEAAEKLLIACRWAEKREGTRS